MGREEETIRTETIRKFIIAVEETTNGEETSH